MSIIWKGEGQQKLKYHIRRKATKVGADIKTVGQRKRDREERV